MDASRVPESFKAIDLQVSALMVQTRDRNIDQMQAISSRLYDELSVAEADVEGLRSATKSDGLASLKGDLAAKLWLIRNALDGLEEHARAPQPSWDHVEASAHFVESGRNQLLEVLSAI